MYPSLDGTSLKIILQKDYKVRRLVSLNCTCTALEPVTFKFSWKPLSYKGGGGFSPITMYPSLDGITATRVDLPKEEHDKGKPTVYFCL